MRRDQSVGCRRSRNHPSARQSGGVYRSRTVVVVVPFLAVRVVVVRSISAPPSAPSSIRANDARVRIAPARVLLSRKSRYDHAANHQDAASAATREAVRILIDDQGIGLRDAGALLGLSYERVRQLHSFEAAGVAPRPGGTVVSSDEL